MRQATGSRAGRYDRFIPTVVAILGIAIPSGVAQALELTFDDTSEPAPDRFQDVWPEGEFGPVLEIGAANLDGAVIGLAVTPADQAATTSPQFYVTTDFQELADGSLLPGEITVTLEEPADLVALDIGNGNSFAASFTLTALDGSAVVDSDTVNLAGFGAEGFVGDLEVGAASITAFTVTSNQPAGTKLFSVDTVEVSLLPEPGSSLLVLLGVGALAIREKRMAVRRR